MATSARIGHGTLFAVGDGASPEVFTTIAEVTSLTPPGTTKDIIDATHMESPGEYREFIVGLKDGTECKVEMNFVPGGPGQDIIADLQASSDPSNFTIRWVNGEVWAFAAYCTGFEPSAPVDDKMTATATFKATGVINYAGSP